MGEGEDSFFEKETPLSRVCPHLWDKLKFLPVRCDVAFVANLFVLTPCVAVQMRVVVQIYKRNGIFVVIINVV